VSGIGKRLLMSAPVVVNILVPVRACFACVTLCYCYLQPKHVVMVPPGMKPKSAITSTGKLKKKPEVVSCAVLLVPLTDHFCFCDMLFCDLMTKTRNNVIWVLLIL